MKRPPLSVFQYCICCIGFQEFLLTYLELETNSTQTTLTLHGYPTIVWFMAGIRMLIIALWCPVELISDLADFPWLYDLGFYIPSIADKEEKKREREREKEKQELLQAEMAQEAERRKENEDIIVDVLVDENGNFVLDENGEFVTMRPTMTTTTPNTTTTSSTPIPLTPPPPNEDDPFNPFTGIFS